MAGARGEDKDGRRHITDEEVGNDNCEDPSQFPLGAGDEVQTRIQHNRLSYYHALPTDVDHADTKHREVDDAEEFEEQTESIRNNGHGGDDERPEVEAMSTAEGQRNENQEFDHVVECDTSEGGDQLRDLECCLDGARAHVVVRHLVGDALVNKT